MSPCWNNPDASRRRLPRSLGLRGVVVLVALGLAWIAPWGAVPAQDAPVPEVRFRLTRASGQPGDLVGVELWVESSAPLKYVQVAFDFDESVLRLEETKRAVVPNFPFDDVAQLEVDNRDDSTGNQSEEGWVALQLTASESGEVNAGVVPAPALKLYFRILEGAPRGVFPLQFRQVGPQEAAPGAERLNAVAFKIPDQLPAGQDLFQLPDDALEDGQVHILGLGEVGFFLRADANLDRVRDISDPVRILTSLFKGDASLLCMDAADANDDGSVDLSDAVYTLQWLYASGKEPPSPVSWGGDPTPDDLCCEDTGGCS